MTARTQHKPIISVEETTPGHWQVLVGKARKPWIAGVGPNAKDWYSMKTYADEVSISQRGAIYAAWRENGGDEGVDSTALTVWVPDGPDELVAEYKGAELRVYVDANTLRGQYEWTADLYQQVIRGGYPGWPDCDEFHFGDGTAHTLDDARWKAMRCAERAFVADDAYGWEETEFYAQGNPEDPDDPKARETLTPGEMIAEHTGNAGWLS